MKNRNEGSTNQERKSKSLIQRWFSKNEYKHDKEKEKDINKEEIHIKRYSLIEMICKKKEGKKQAETKQLYRVLALFDKHYNKWHICEDNSILWHPNYPKKKFLVLASMV